MGRNINAASMGSYGASWIAAGYSGCGNVEDLIGTLGGYTVVVCGNAAGVFDELTDALSRAEKPIIFAVNDIGMFLPKVDHWVSLHGEKMEHWMNVRWDQNFSSPIMHSIQDVHPVTIIWDKLTPLMALSGYFAMQIAYIMGASQIVLCGCPGEPKARFFEGSKREDFDYAGGTRDQLIGEMNRLPDFKNRVRSMSGWTKSYFGGLP